jgi:3-oxoacyl-[acyl-carrier protein] reductase
MIKKNILITGGSKGLGFELAKKYILKNNVSIVSRNRGNLTKNFNFVKSDLTVSKMTFSALKKIKKKFNKIDLIICCTGGGKKISHNELSNKTLKKYFDLNLFTVTNFIDAYIKVYKKKRTKIIVISSIVSKKIINAPIGYSIAKAALDFFVKILAKRLAKEKISINLISPGNILIKNNIWHKKMKKSPRLVMKYINSNVPNKKFISADDIFEITKIFLNDNSGNITGTDFIIDGGQSL